MGIEGAGYVKPKVYVETSVFSLIVARPSRDKLMAERQIQTRDWWQTDAATFDLYASETVRFEAARGNAEMSAKRLALSDSIKILPTSEAAHEICDILIGEEMLSAKATTDALHVGVATIEKMDFLATWHCVHLANGHILRRVVKRLEALGYDVPQVVTPEQLPGVPT